MRLRRRHGLPGLLSFRVGPVRAVARAGTRRAVRASPHRRPTLLLCRCADRCRVTHCASRHPHRMFGKSVRVPMVGLRIMRRHTARLRIWLCPGGPLDEAPYDRASSQPLRKMRAPRAGIDAARAALCENDEIVTAAQVDITHPAFFGYSYRRTLCSVDTSQLPRLISFQCCLAYLPF